MAAAIFRKGCINVFRLAVLPLHHRRKKVPTCDKSNSLTDIRLGHASRLLIDSPQPISEVAYNCGFNNISNFNRIFRKKKNCTPKEFRDEHLLSSGARSFV